MKQQMNRRLKELKSEFDSGQQVMTELEVKKAHTKSMLLRISGAIQVLEELLNQDQVAEKKNDSPDGNPIRFEATG